MIPATTWDAVKPNRFARLIASKVPHRGFRSVELDFIRGIAILMVIGYHAFILPNTNPIFVKALYPFQQYGHYGVDLFFVLSGFLVGGLLMKEYKQTQTVEVKRFIFRRGLKIWPAYYVFILLQVITRSHPLKTFLWQNLLHVQNYARSALFHTWTLSVEEHFYLALALGMGWMVRRQWPPLRMLKLCGGVMLVGLAARSISFFTLGVTAAERQTQNRIDGLVCGVSLAVLFHFFPAKFEAISRRKYVLTLTLVAAALFLCTFRSPVMTYTIGCTISYIGAAALLLLTYSNSTRIREWIVYRSIAAIGVYSYGIYLYHVSMREPSIKLATHLPQSLQGVGAILLEFSSAIFVGAIMTKIVEWPLLRYRDRILPQRVRDISSPTAVSQFAREAEMLK